jgi:hypothetical protein
VVLIAGWENKPVNNAATSQGGGNGFLVDSLEIYDIYAGTFTLTAQSLLPRVAFNANRQLWWNGSPGTATNAGRFHHTSAKLPDGSVMICGGYGEPWLPQAFTTDDAQLFFPSNTGSGVGGIVKHAGSNLTVPRACHTATVLPTGDEAGVVIVAGGFTNSPYTGVLASVEMFDYKEIASAGIWAGDKGCFAPLAQAMSIARHNHIAALVMGGSHQGGVLFAGGAQHMPVQNPFYPLPNARLYPWLEPTGCGACRVTTSSDLLQPYFFGRHTTNPFRGLNVTAGIGRTTNPQGTVTNLSNIYSAGVYFHDAVPFSNGVVLITGGAWCPFCMQGPNAWSTYFTAIVNGWRVNGPSCIYNP